MRLTSLNLRNFRTYEKLSLSFHDKFNLIYGNNAQGKTNLLEAVYHICSSRSFKSAKNEELISFGKSDAGIKGEIVSERGLDEVNLYIGKDKKTLKLNGKVIRKLSSNLGKFSIVLFLPKDSEIVKGNPGVRRRYLDALICNLAPDHLTNLKDYNKAISHRNNILSRGKLFNDSVLEAWDIKVAELGSNLTIRREKIIKKISDKIGELYNSTSGVNAKIEVIYKTSYKKGEDIQSSILKALKESLDKDRIRGHTTVGPHRDSIGFLIDGNDTTTYASQGESKNFVLALKAAEIYIYSSIKGQTPILLLDDITSELDKNRRGFLFKLLQNYGGQVFVTSTGVEEIPYTGDKKIFKVTKGTARAIT